MEYHKTESDHTKQVVFIKYHEAAEKLAAHTERIRAKEESVLSLQLPKSDIAPIEMAKYRGITFESLEEEQIFESKFLAVSIISEPFVSNDGQYNFLAMDQASKSNRVVRFSVVDNPDLWGLFCYQKG